MKKMYVLSVLALALCLLLAGCGGGNGGESGGASSGTSSGGQAGEGGFVFTYKGAQIQMHAPAQPVLDALGAAKSTYEEPSCAYQGMDVFYNYGSIELAVYTDEGQKNILSVYLRDDTVSTAEGLSIGDDAAKVETLYGSAGKTETGSYSFSKGKSKLNIVIENEKVKSIEYSGV